MKCDRPSQRILHALQQSNEVVEVPFVDEERLSALYVFGVTLVVEAVSELVVTVCRDSGLDGVVAIGELHGCSEVLHGVLARVGEKVAAFGVLPVLGENLHQFQLIGGQEGHAVAVLIRLR
ncbi:hypothetical protein ACFFX0_23985 [Citricoccus parietis]|uniref:Uncharacterized protein n=1 Tax=Citricoccus parietis TaxID=592307 RepID=A0ABV5FSU3_9MICC